MSSREQILGRIRRQLPQALELPDHDGDWIQYDDPIEQFRSVLESVGGVLHCLPEIQQIPAALGDLIAEDKKVVSCVPGVLDDRFDWSAIDGPHDLADVDHAILPGELAVAENAAIWVTDAQVPMRVVYFLSQHLSLVVPRDALVNNLHEAYQRILPQQRAFGCLISGPSKTADIEQSLVKGAHGARTLNVFLVDNMS